MSTDTAPAEHPRKRGERTDSSIKKLPNGQGWRARPTLGADPVTGKQVRPTKVFATKKAAQGWVNRAAPAVERLDLGAEVHAHVR
jgi:hypothetical protein